MKQVLLLILAFSLLTACNKIERGTPDTDTSARKLFDTLRDNDFHKSTYLMPDKGTFRKIEEQLGVTIADLNLAHEAFTKSAETQFNSIRSMVPAWDKCKYLHSTKEDAASGKPAMSTVTVKFEGDGGPYKFQFTCVKFNNRWYYMGDATWIPK
ncbi:MAG: hypothetical protein ACHQFW_07090 [Chitinophagales bacterium]